MKKLFAIALCFLFCSAAWAATPCNLFDANFKWGPPVHNSDGNCLVWFCSNNHGWDAWYLCNATGGVTGAVIDHLNGLTQASQAQRDSEWAALVANPPAAGTAEDRLLKAAALTSTPQDPPLDGWVTRDTKLYKQEFTVGSYVLTQVGTIGLGIPCDATTSLSSTSGKYYAVNRNDPTVKFTKVGNFIVPKPTTVFARCN